MDTNGHAAGADADADEVVEFRGPGRLTLVVLRWRGASETDDGSCFPIWSRIENGAASRNDHQSQLAWVYLIR